MANQVMTEVAIIVTICYGIITTMLLTLKIRELNRRIIRLEFQHRGRAFRELVGLSEKMGLYDDK
jgi:hypothetical protein